MLTACLAAIILMLADPASNSNKMALQKKAARINALHAAGLQLQQDGPEQKKAARINALHAAGLQLQQDGPAKKRRPE
jgi:hypothetical protein